MQILFTNGLITNDAKVSTESQLNDGVKILTDIFYEFDKGDNSKCYDLLRQLLILYKKILVSKEFFINLSRNTQLYRIRTDKLLPSDRNEYDLFHIPFRKRHLVSNLRFNPPGIPCLYCSSNLLTCYKEMKKDLKLFDTSELDSIANNSLNVAIFKNDIMCNGLDLSFKNFELLEKNISTNLKLYINYIIIYPLISTLHSKIADRAHPINFKIEYMLPSFAMSWLFNQISTGFKYFSLPVDFFKYSSVMSKDLTVSKNYAFPSRYSTTEDYCKILKTIFMNSNRKYYYTDDLFTLIKKNELTEADVLKIESLIH